MPDTLPMHRKFGYSHMMEMREIEDTLRASGLNGSELHFACVNQYEARHRNDPSYHQRQEKWASSPSVQSPSDLIRRALEEIRDGHNDPRTLARDVLAATNKIPGGNV